MQLPPFPFTVLDTETTGFVPRVHRVIEFASVQVTKGEIADTYTQLFAADEIPPVVQALTHIHPQDLAGKPMFADRREEILAHIGEDTAIVGQNIAFDFQMLKGEGLDLTDRPWIDTAMFASLVFPELESYSLGYLSRVLHLRHDPPHRALGDVTATLDLLAVCWGRLLELSGELLDVSRAITERGPEGWKRIFASLPAATKKRPPEWLRSKECAMPPTGSLSFDLPGSEKGTVYLLEEPLDPGFLRRIIISTTQKKKAVHWIAVKNLEATVRRECLASGKTLRILQPPFLLPDHSAVARFARQQKFTADEVTLALKLAWYEPETRGDLPIHGNEDAVWSGKIACTETSPNYTAQFEDLLPVITLDHRQLLSFLADLEHAAHGALREHAHIVIDDASMLEDTATKAYGWRCPLDDLRAAAEGDATLTRFTDLLQIWVERTRQFQELRMIARSDLETPEAKGLRMQLQELLEHTLAPQVQRKLSDLQKILDPENLQGRIVWIEQWHNGIQELQSVPERIGTFLKEHLYDRFPTTLFIPPGSAEYLQEILPPGIKTQTASGERQTVSSVPLTFPEHTTIEQLLTSPLPGKTIVLIQSKALIEECYVKHAEPLEAKGVTLLCQGISGGQGRSQAEFLASPAPAVWLMTSWMFESLELPPGTVDHLMISAFPFDHPSHTVLGKRAARYRDGFTEYFLPRLEQRLFRILRAFCRFRTEHGDIAVLDERIRTKDYGKRLRQYLMQFALPPENAPALPPLPTPKTTSKNQPSLF